MCTGTDLCPRENRKKYNGMPKYGWSSIDVETNDILWAVGLEDISNNDGGIHGQWNRRSVLHLNMLEKIRALANVYAPGNRPLTQSLMNSTFSLNLGIFFLWI